MDFNPILTEIQSHFQSMSPEAQGAVRTAGMIPPPPVTNTPVAPTAPPTHGMLLPHSDTAPPPQGISMGNQTPSLSMPKELNPQPQLVTGPNRGQEMMTNGQQVHQGTLLGDQTELSRSLDEGAGVNSIAHRIEGAMPNHPLLGKILGWGAQVPAMIGDTALEAASPIARMALSQVPGTYAHQEMLLGQERGQVHRDIANDQTQAQTASENATAGKTQAETEEIQQKPEESQAKLNQTQQFHDQQLREHGFKTDNQGKLVPLEYGEMSEPQQAVHDLKASQEELADATTALKKAQTAGIPAQVQMAQQRIQTAQSNAQTAQSNAQTAAGRLGLSRESLGFRESQSQDKQETPSTFAHGRADQGRAVVESANNLKKFIDEHPAVSGNIGSYWSKFTNGTPIADPDASKAMAEIASFAALQPALHGMRGGQVMKEFENMIGGIPKNAASLKAAIDGIVESAANPMIHAGTKPQKGNSSPSTGAAPQHNEGDSVMLGGKQVTIKKIYRDGTFDY